MKRVSRVVGAMLAFAGCLTPEVACADDTAPNPAAAAAPASPETAPASNADELFQHGVELMKADRCAEAIPEFLQSNSLDPSAGTYINLGTCYARLGRKATAWKTYQQAVLAAQTEHDEALRERALQAMTVLGPTLTKVQIVTPKSSQPLSLRLNGEPLVDYDGLPIPLDPGVSVIEAAAPGREPWRHSVTANDLGATIVIQVPELVPVPNPAPPPFLADRPASPPDLRVPATVVGGIGLATVLVGSIFGLSAAHSYDDSQQYCVGAQCTPPGIDLRDRASTKAAVATWTVSIGLVATATGVVMWLLSPHSSNQRASASAWSPSLGNGTMMFINERR